MSNIVGSNIDSSIAIGPIDSSISGKSFRIYSELKSSDSSESLEEILATYNQTVIMICNLTDCSMSTAETVLQKWKGDLIPAVLELWDN